MPKVDNAVIMAAGTSSRFAPISYETPKSLIRVKGEVLIERQIRQLHEAGIQDVTVVVGYKKEKFEYLKEKLGVKLVENNDFLTRNNNASIYAVKDLLKNTYLCSSDNYFEENPFENFVEDSYYAAVYAEHETNEWCLTCDEQGYITHVKVGGAACWYMMGHTFWSESFSKKFLEILERIYDRPETADLYWEDIFMQNLDVLKMKIKKYAPNDIFEFDTLDELRQFDTSYINHTRSEILQEVAAQLGCSEGDLRQIKAYKDKDNAAAGFYFSVGGHQYQYDYQTKQFTAR